MHLQLAAQALEVWSLIELYFECSGCFNRLRNSLIWGNKKSFNGEKEDGHYFMTEVKENYHMR